MNPTLGMYRPRNTPMHQAPAWFKAVLLVVIAAVFVLFTDPITSVGLMAACVLLLISTGPPLKATAQGLLGIVIIAALSGGFHVWRGEIDRAIDLAADLVGLVALALAVTSSTPMEHMLDLVSRILRPLRRVIPPETMGLMFAITVRAVPEVARMMSESRSAAKARGLDRSFRAVLIPTTTRTVGFALDLGQALHARGIAEEGDNPAPYRRARRVKH
ncbi:MAG: hypothetical protein CVT64_05890 [Actinobacteria bacterium HGW-Actinobacteria-4]|nr:MAG: hypothetical protein CVT64_05890 [Actinobacteria bacterium HGW-Actinobacteria-4]